MNQHGKPLSISEIVQNLVNERTPKNFRPMSVAEIKSAISYKVRTSHERDYRRKHGFLNCPKCNDDHGSDATSHQFITLKIEGHLKRFICKKCSHYACSELAIEQARKSWNDESVLREHDLPWLYLGYLFGLIDEDGIWIL